MKNRKTSEDRGQLTLIYSWWAFTEEKYTRMFYDPAIPLLGVRPTETHTYVHP